jgi:Reverse transcriptase (RNA-dependent DNA polymerase)
MRDQMVNFLQSTNALDALQSGFRVSNSTTTALFCITDDIYKYLDDGMLAFLVLLDFSKAFDKVNHELLCYKLMNKFSFSSSAANYIQSYLSSRFQCVGSDDSTSQFLPIFAGVPQGSILGPLLFSLFINDLCRVIRTSKYHAYADDFQIYDADKISYLSNCCDRINRDLEVITQWATDNGLQLNARKTKAIIICRDQGRLPANLPLIRLNGESVEFSSKVNNLGLTMDIRFSWLPQAKEVRRKVNFALSRHKIATGKVFYPSSFLIIAILYFPRHFVKFMMN